MTPFSLSETSAYLLASFRNLSANDNELALSNSNRVRCLFVEAAVLLTAAVLILSFLSSSVMPKAMTLSVMRSPLSIGLDAVVFSATGALSTAFFEKLKLICTFFGDTFGDSMSTSVFFVLIVGCVDKGGGGAGTFIVADADVFIVLSCDDGGVGIVNVAELVSAFDAADDEGAVIVYDATTVSLDELNGIVIVLDTLGAFVDDVAITTLSSADDLIAGTRSLLAVVMVVVDDVLVAEFSL